LIARDIYAIPVSTVASESVFSTGRRFITPHRNHLHPKTLEALICGRDWLWTTIKSSSEDIFLNFCYTFGIYSWISLCLNVMIFNNLITLTYLLNIYVVDEDTAYCHGNFDEDYDAEVDEEFDG